MLLIRIQDLGREGHVPEFLWGVSPEPYLASFVVPVDDVVVELGLEPLVRVEFAVAGGREFDSQS